jgi:hypothetical protein
MEGVVSLHVPSDFVYVNSERCIWSLVTVTSNPQKIVSEMESPCSYLARIILEDGPKQKSGTWLKHHLLMTTN